MQGLSLVAASGGHSSSRCAGLSLWWPLLLRSTSSRRAGSVIVTHGLSYSVACGIFPDQGSNPCPLHWQADSQPLRHQGSPVYLFLISFDTSSLTHKLFINVLISKCLVIFHCLSGIDFLLDFIMSENILYNLNIYIYIYTYNIIWCIFVNVPWALEKFKYSVLVGWSALYFNYILLVDATVHIFYSLVW